jgi:molybdate transport system substrate-binding protein
LIVSGVARCVPFIASLLAIFLPSDLQAGDVRVAVASNFSVAAATLARRFEEETGHRVELISGATGKHFAQIMHGAPFDVFLAADRQRPEKLVRSSRAIDGSRFTYALGKLVLWSADPGLVDREGQVLKTPGFKRLAMANPDLAPYGQAAMQLMEALGVWQQVRPRLVYGENVNQAFQFVVTANAQLGFVARSQLISLSPETRGSRWEIPQSLYAPIEQQAVALSGSQAASEFLAFLRGEPARSIIREFGYDTP